MQPDGGAGPGVVLADDTAEMDWTEGSIILHNEELSDSIPVAWKQGLLIAIFLFRLNNNTLKKPSITCLNGQRRKGSLA